MSSHPVDKFVAGDEVMVVKPKVFPTTDNKDEKEWYQIFSDLIGKTGVIICKKDSLILFYKVSFSHGVEFLFEEELEPVKPFNIEDYV